MTPFKEPFANQTSQEIRVFVSYSRMDTAFVDRLERGLLARGIQTLLDREQIAKLEAWWERITALIGQAHSVVFVLSPNWLQSDVCRKELDLALKMKKRLAPVVHGRVQSNNLPTALEQLNWVSFLPAENFEAALDALVAGFRTDIEWIREQARISEQARYWDRDGRSEGALLRDEALFAAEHWLARRPNNAPPPTELLSDYLRICREVHEREERARRDLLDRTLTSQSRMLAERAQQLLDRGDAASGILLCIEALPDESHAIQRPLVHEAEVVCYNALSRLREHHIYSLWPQTIYDTAVTDDGKRILAITSDGPRVWDAATSDLLACFTGDRVIFTIDGQRIVTTDQKTLRVWNWESPSPTPQLLQEFAVGVAPPIEELLAGRRAWIERDDRLELVQITAGQEPLPLRKSLPIEKDYENVSFSSDGQRIVTTAFYNFGFPAAVRTWNALTGEKIAELNGHEGYVRSAEFSPDGSRVATASADRTARVWDAQNGKLLRILHGHEDEVACARFSPDSSMLVTGSYDNSFCLWDLSSGEKIAVLRGHVGDIAKTTDIIKGFSPTARFAMDGKQVVTIWNDQTARVWDVGGGNRLQCVLTGHKGRVNSVSFHPDGTRFATASDDKTIILWDAKKRTPASTLCQVNRKVRDITFSSDGSKLAAAVGSEIVIWDIVSEKEAGRISVEEEIGSIAFSPDDAWVAACYPWKGVAVWEISTGNRISRFEEGDSGYCVRFAPSGLVAVSCGDERAIRLWNPKTGTQIGSAIFQGHSVWSVAFDPHGRRIVIGSADKTFRIWTVGTEPCDNNIVVLSGHDGDVRSAAFSPSGEQVVTASQDGTVRLWDSTTGQQLAIFAGHSGEVAKAVFSPSGEQIVSVSYDKTVRIWQLFPTVQTLVDYAKEVVPRALTEEQRKAFFRYPSRQLGV